MKTQLTVKSGTPVDKIISQLAVLKRTNITRVEIKVSL